MMKNKIKVAMIGLDISHAVEYTKLMQDPAIPADRRVCGMVVEKCLRFETPFQNQAGLDKRQQTLEQLGVAVGTDFDSVTADCDAVIMTINDPSKHPEFFEKCASLGKPVFINKPFADTLENALKMIETAEKCSTRFFTASPLRFDCDLANALNRNISPQTALVWGPLVNAPAGSSITWYGIHVFEMLQRIMGNGAVCVNAMPDSKGYVCHVIYGDGRRGIAELSRKGYRYGGVIRDDRQEEVMFQVTDQVPYYRMLLLKVAGFFQGENQGVPHGDSLEIMAMISAAERSITTGRPEPVYTKSYENEVNPCFSIL